MESPGSAPEKICIDLLIASKLRGGLESLSIEAMETLSTFNLKRWVDENRHLFNPPFRTNQLIVHHKDFLVMILRGPNTRLDFHIEPGDEFFYQIEGDMELHLKPPRERSSRSNRERFLSVPAICRIHPAAMKTPGAWSSNANAAMKKRKSLPGSARSATNWYSVES
jgi:hypothetical protein